MHSVIVTVVDVCHVKPDSNIMQCQKTIFQGLKKFIVQWLLIYDEVIKANNTWYN